MGAIAFITSAFKLNTWARSEHALVQGSPETLEPPTIRFAALLPARHKSGVIACTMQPAWNTRYPRDILEFAFVGEHKELLDSGPVLARSLLWRDRGDGPYRRRDSCT